jgi:ubiquinone biosynthesis protein
MHLKRYRQIAEILIRNGLGYLVEVLRLKRFVPFHHGNDGQDATAESIQPARVRLALEELGATFIKFGQILSTRPDLLPPQYVKELAKLHDDAAPVASDTIVEVVAAELGKPVEAAFARFDRQPLAAASIGQAHAATLPDGTDVVVKIRRPGVVEQVHEDIEILRNVAAAASHRWPVAAQYDLIGLTNEFADTLQSELDYVREGKNAERFARNFDGDASVHIPRVFWDTSTSRVLTLERVRGVKVDNPSAIAGTALDGKTLAQRAVGMLLKMIFEDGFFHADPHPGNFFIEPGGRIGLVDFGMVGTVDESSRERLADLLLALTSRDADRVVDGMLDLGAIRGHLDRDGLRADLDRLLSRYAEVPLGSIAFGAVLEEALAIVRGRHLQMPSNFALLLKTLIMAEGLGARLDPGFQFIEELQPHAERLALRQYSPVAWGRRMAKASVDAARLAAELPGEVRRVLQAVDRSNLEFGIRRESIEPLVERLERLTNRLVLGILAAAFIVGLAVLLLIYHPTGWEAWAGVAFGIGFAIAAGVGVYLAWTIIRSRHR